MRPPVRSSRNDAGVSDYEQDGDTQNYGAAPDGGICNGFRVSAGLKSLREVMPSRLVDLPRAAIIRLVGTDAWRNALAFEAGAAEIENVDDELHSDRNFVGSAVDFGPYRLSIIFRADHRADVHVVGPAMLLRLGVHENLVPQVVVDGELAEANSDAYHGGDISDEIAALASLALGVRLRVAGTVRMSGIHDPENPSEPIYWEVPALVQPGRPGHELIPAALTRPADLALLQRLASLQGLPEDDEVELVRASRAYASGLWWANEDPNQAWLQFVSAVEIAANQRQTSKADPVELVEQLWPELWESLQPLDTEQRAAVCKVLAPQVRSTRKFIDFLVACLPDAPNLRPASSELDWSVMNDHARLIYRHRSKALHGGKPFPLPMLEEPRIEENGAVQEVPYGLNSGGLGGVWDAAEVPMLLSTFEYIVRGSLLRWWDELTA